jgi:hypothetical protein
MKKTAKTMIEVNHTTETMSVYQVYQQPSEKGYTSPVKTFPLKNNPEPIQRVIDDLITVYGDEN